MFEETTRSRGFRARDTSENNLHTRIISTYQNVNISAYQNALQDFRPIKKTLKQVATCNMDRHPILRSASFYATLHILTQSTISKFIDPSLLSKVDLIYLAEKLPSCINASVVSLSAIKTIFISKAYLPDPLSPGFLLLFNYLDCFYPEEVDRIFSTQLGFTLYDMGVMLYVGETSSSAWLHHIVTALGTFFIRRFRQASFYPCWFSVSTCDVSYLK
jgi:hypothetical protein